MYRYVTIFTRRLVLYKLESRAVVGKSRDAVVNFDVHSLAINLPVAFYPSLVGKSSIGQSLWG